MTIQEIEIELEKLRKKWREKPHLRGIIERQAKLFKKSLGQVEEITEDLIKKIFSVPDK